MSDDPVKVDLYLDDDPEPIASYKPPARFDLDTTKLPDGNHCLRIKAMDRSGFEGVREIPFVVHNGPGIAVVGLNPGDIVEGKISVLVNAYGGSTEPEWEPVRAETPAPIPTWAWVLFLVIVAWAIWYGASQWTPAPELANTPTFSSPEVIQAAAPKPAAPPVSAKVEGFDWQKIGETVYKTRCGDCHMADGSGLPAFVPPLKGNAVVNAQDPTLMIRTILNGVKQRESEGSKWTGEMPAFGKLLTDAEIASVVNYQRTNWGNNAPLIGPDDVRALRTTK